MRVDFRPPVFPQPDYSQSTIGSFVQSFTQPFFKNPVFRPFVQPFFKHPFVRKFVQPSVQPSTRRPFNPTTTTRSTTFDTATKRNWDGKDPTLRPNDPYAANVRMRSFDERQATDNLTRGNHKWHDKNGDGKVSVSYSFNSDAWQFDGRQREMARRAMQSWSDVSKLSFEENGPRTEGKMSFGISSAVSTAVGYYPSNHYQGGATLYNPNRVTRHDLIHETGHALGLYHTGNYNGGYNENRRSHVQDSQAHSVMSYFGASLSGKNHGGAKPTSAMMDDISAIQALYGVNRKIRHDDTTYGFNSNSQRDYYTLNSNQDKAVFCIWDGDGKDTLDVSGYRSNQTINLKAGSYSDVGGLKGNVSIARGVVMENAIGGSGDDAMIGNDADNRLTGGAGGDRLRGGGGADTFDYNSASDSTPDNPDTIMDFVSGTDKINVSVAMKNAKVGALAFVSEMTGKAGQTVLTYDEQSGKGSLAIDLTGDGKADLLIRTYGQVKAEDIVASTSAEPQHQRLEAPSIRSAITPARPPHRSITHAYEKVSDSPYHNADLIENFVSGKDKINLADLVKNTGIPLRLVDNYSGRVGDTVVKFNSHSGRYFVGVDLTGNRRTNFLIKSTQLLDPRDIMGLTENIESHAKVFPRR
ncbi:Serralysin precursor [Pseudomonas sp. 22 E 5]|uniref:M10 family metallopeptidase C-terminal domain-containing protein n=1 Tax=Pseudomonas salomonii TaxID=191391 RepID=UPI0008128ED6|nr:M10 family metallopeptidase C-terminal domain-containing protein [Pseudomonas salomonii]CRM89586.1 Serralysin precursor [Pseudomonas sp. 22 E 5]